MSIYEKAFAKSDKTDAVLLVDGKKFHVNKAVLSYHSEYFYELFNSDFQEKSMDEIEIKDVNFVNFAAVLSLIHNTPLTTYCSEEHLDVADRFKLPAAKRHLEQFLISFDYHSLNHITIAEKYQLNDLMDIALSQLTRDDYYSVSSYNREPDLECFDQLSDETNIKLFHRFLEIRNRATKLPNVKDSQMSIYEKTFAKTDKTDAVLVVQGKKLHVNKALIHTRRGKIDATRKTCSQSPMDLKNPL